MNIDGDFKEEDGLTPQARNHAEKKEELKEEMEKVVVYDGNPNVAGGIVKTTYKTEAMIELILANPGITQNELASKMGYTPSWVSRVMSSDAFKQMFAKMKKELVHPMIVAETEERFRALTDRSLDLLFEKLEGANMEGLIKAADLGSRALGYGAAKGQGVNVNVNTFVVALPEKAKSTADWAGKHGRTIDVKPEA